MKSDFINMAKGVVDSISKNLRQHFKTIPAVDFVEILAKANGVSTEEVENDPHAFGLITLHYQNGDGEIEEVVIHRTTGTGLIWVRDSEFVDFQIELEDLASIEDEIYLAGEVEHFLEKSNAVPA